jgi:hypothetical protein
MAMSKKEQAALAEAQREVVLARALRWSRDTPLAPDVPVPAMGRTEGWNYNPLIRSVHHDWSEPYRNGRVGQGHGSYSGVALYSTKELALRALRHAVERQAATDLTRIDEMIANAVAEG